MNSIFQNDIKIKNLSEYITVTEQLKKKWDVHELWFRGVGDSNYELIPSLYRGEFKVEADEEYAIFNDFKLKAKSYLNNGPVLSNLEWYSIMQHYGLPTRLLDWTTGSLIALFFALRDTNADKNRSVYIINQQKFNDKLHKFDELYESENWLKKRDEILLKQLPNTVIGEFPLAIIPPHIDKRIVAQKSRFTLHGSNRDSIENICDIHGINIARIDIDLSLVYSLKMELVQAGITESVLYPDLEGLAIEFIFEYVLD